MVLLCLQIWYRMVPEANPPNASKPIFLVPVFTLPSFWEQETPVCIALSCCPAGRCDKGRGEGSENFDLHRRNCGVLVPDSLGQAKGCVD